jgi:hypothetical protein
MGLYPSFALFALTHNLLLRTLAKQLDLDPDTAFRVLGDDVLISDRGLHDLYVHVLSAIRTPISETKSFASKVFGEFAGKVFWRGHDVTPIKWRRVSTASLDVAFQYYQRGLLVIDMEKQKVKSLPLANGEVVSHVEALLPLPKRLGGFDGLTRLSLADRLAWGGRTARSLRAGYLNRVSERLYSFLTSERILKGLDVTKFQGMFNQGIKVDEVIERAKAFKNVMPGPYGTSKANDVPSSRESLKDLESIAFGTDSLEERLGKFHAWHIASLGPNRVREFNRMLTFVGEPIDLFSIPIVTNTSELRRLSRVRHLPPSQISEMYEIAEEKVKLLTVLKTRLAEKPESIDWSTGVSMGQLLATGVATVLNPIAGLGVGLALAATNIDVEQYKTKDIGNLLEGV